MLEVAPRKADQHRHASDDQSEGRIFDTLHCGERRRFLILALLDLRYERSFIFSTLTIEPSEIDGRAIRVPTEFWKCGHIFSLPVHLLLLGFHVLATVDSEEVERKSPVAIHRTDHRQDENDERRPEQRSIACIRLS
jgi:hypothetical protein